jgi:hypothetical protein
VGINELRTALYEGDELVLQEALDAGTKGAYYLVFALHHAGEVEVVRELLQSEGIAFLQRSHRLGIISEFHGGDKAIVQTRATQVFLIDEGHREAALGSTDGGLIASGAGTYDE